MTTAENAEPGSGHRFAQAPPRTRGVTRNSALARSKLLDAASLLFGRQGFRATSTEQIAEQAGYSQATLFFHFKTKLGVLRACLDEALERAIGALPQASARGALHLVGALDQAFYEHSTADLFTRLMAEQDGNAPIQPVYAAFHAHIRDLIAAELAAETDAPRARLIEAAGAILCMMIGVHAGHRVDSHRFDHSQYRAMLLNVTAMVIDSLRDPGSQP